jgi:aminobenzoyl-glutamate transport protein
MLNKKKLHLKKIKLHPISTFIVLILFVMILSSVLSFFQVQANYSKINSSNELENVTVAVEGLLNFEGFKYLISNAARNFVSFTPLSTLIIALIGLSVAHASGFIDAVIKRGTLKINNKLLTFIIIFVATISSIINEVGYVILIPLSALIFLANGRNPLLGITASFCGVAFGYGVTLFAGSAEISLVSYTEKAAKLIDSGYHVSLLSNLFAIIASSVVVSIVGTMIVENILSKRIGRYHLNNEDKNDEEHGETKEILIEDVEAEQQRKLEEEVRESKGLKNALIALLIFLALFVYMLIPGLPGSGLFLDMNEKAYINRLFGENSYFQDGFTFMISVLFLVLGVAYAKGAKTAKNDRDLIEKSSNYLKDLGYLCALIFFAAQFIAIFKKTNIGTVLIAFISNIIRSLPFGGLPLIIVVLILLALSGLFVTTQASKWALFAPVVVPLLMQNNVSPQFAQFIFRAADSMMKGFSPFLAYFVIYLGYLNVYNTEEEPIGIRKAFSFVAPYCLIISIAWILIVSLIYIIGVPIGPGVSPIL